MLKIIARCAPRNVGRALALRASQFYVRSGATSRQTAWETRMTWKTPKIVEVPVGMEINMYACAARK
jgi:coenzyme PQQ precursor peptide PqqA